MPPFAEAVHTTKSQTGDTDEIGQLTLFTVAMNSDVLHVELPQFVNPYIVSNVFVVALPVTGRIGFVDRKASGRVISRILGEEVASVADLRMVREYSFAPLVNVVGIVQAIVVGVTDVTEHVELAGLAPAIRTDICWLLDPKLVPVNTIELATL